MAKQYNESKDTMLIHFMPSEIARLVLGYIKEIGCVNTTGVFLAECKQLKEYFECLQSGQEYPTDIGGKSLKNILQDYCRLKSEAKPECHHPAPLPPPPPPAIDNLSPLVQQLEELLPQMRQVLGLGCRNSQPTPFKSINRSSVLQKNRTRCAIVEAQRHTIDDIQPCQSQEASNSAINLDSTTHFTTETVTASIPVSPARNINTTVTAAASGITSTTFVTTSTANTITTVASIEASENTSRASVTGNFNCTLNATCSSTTNSAVAISGSSSCVGTTAVTVTGTTTTTTVSIAGTSTNLVTSPSIRNVAASSRRIPVSLLKTCSKSKLLPLPAFFVEDTPAIISAEPLVVSNADELPVTSDAVSDSVLSNVDMVDDAGVWISSQDRTAQVPRSPNISITPTTRVCTDERMLIDRACSPVLIEECVVDAARPSTSTEGEHRHPPLCTPMKFGIFSEDSNFRSPRRKCQLPKRRNAQTPSQSARKRNQVVQDEDSITSLDCQSEESIDLSALLGQLINNTALHEKLAENINKVVSTSAPTESEEIIMETPVKVVPIMPPPAVIPVLSSPVGSVTDTPSKELFVPESLIKDIVDRTESDPMFEELLTSFFDNIKIDSNTSSLDSTFPETLTATCASASEAAQLQSNQPQLSEQASISNDVSAMLNSVLSDTHNSPVRSEVQSHISAPMNVFSFHNSAQNSPLNEGVISIGSEVCVGSDGAEPARDVQSWETKPADTGLPPDDRPSDSPQQEIQIIQDWTKTTVDTTNVPSNEVLPVTKDISPTRNLIVECQSSTSAINVSANDSSVSAPSSKSNSDFSGVKDSGVVQSESIPKCAASTTSVQKVPVTIMTTVASNCENLQAASQSHMPVTESTSSSVIAATNEPDFSSLQLIEPEVLVTESPQLYESVHSESEQSLQTPYKTSSLGPPAETITPKSNHGTSSQNNDSQQLHLIVTKTSPAKASTPLAKNTVGNSLPSNKTQHSSSGDISTYSMRSLMPISFSSLGLSSSIPSNLKSPLHGNSNVSSVRTTASTPTIPATPSHSRLPQVVVLPREWNNSLPNASSILKQPASNTPILSEPRISIMGEQPLLIQQPSGGAATLLMPTLPSANTNQVLMTIPGANGTSTLQLIAMPQDVNCSTVPSSTAIVPKLPIPFNPLKGSVSSRKALRLPSGPGVKRPRPRGHTTKDNASSEGILGHPSSTTVVARDLFYVSAASPPVSTLPVSTTASLSYYLSGNTTRNLVSQNETKTITATATTTIITATTTSLNGVRTLGTATLRATQMKSVSNSGQKAVRNKTAACSILRKASSTMTATVSSPAPTLLSVIPATSKPVSPVTSAPVPLEEIVENAAVAANTPTSVSAFQSTTSCTVSIIKSMPSFKTNFINSPSVSNATLPKPTREALTTPGRRKNQTRSPQLKSLVNSVRRATSIKPRGNHIRVLDFNTPPKQRSSPLHFTPKRRNGNHGEQSDQKATSGSSSSRFTFFPNISNIDPKPVSHVVPGDKLKTVIDGISRKKNSSEKIKKCSDPRPKQVSSSSASHRNQSSSKNVPRTVDSLKSKSNLGTKSRSSVALPVSTKCSESPKKSKRKQTFGDRPGKKPKTDKVNVLTAMDVDTFLAKLHYVE